MPSVNSFIELIQQPSLGLVMATIPYLGTYRKAFDTYNRTRTISGSPQWRHNKGFGFFPNADGRLIVADSGAAPELQLTAGTILTFSPQFNPNGVIQYIVSKQDVGGENYSFIWGGVVNRISFVGNVTSQLTSTAFAKAKMVGVKFSSGDAPSFYADGSFSGVGALAVTTVVNDADLCMGAIYTGTSPLLSPLQCVLIFNTQLSDLNISTITERFLNLPPVDRMSPWKGAKFVSIPADPLIDAKCTEVFDGDRAPNGTYIGKKGVSVGTISGIVTSYSGGQVLPGAMVGHVGGSSRVELSNPASLLTADNGAIELIVTPGQSTPAAGRDVARGAVNTRTYIQQLLNGTWSSTKGNPAVAINSPVGSAHAQHYANLLLTWEFVAGIRTAEFFVDGVSQGTAAFLDGAASTAIQLLSNAGAQPFDGKMHMPRFYNQRITPTEARTLYLEHAVTATRQASRNCYPESLANVSAGKVGPWDRGLGSWQWQEDGSKRKLVSIQGGWCSWPSAQAYGAWYFRFKKSGLGDAVGLEITSTDRATPVSGVAGHNGYLFQALADESLVIRRMTNGAVAATPVTTAAAFVAVGTEYEAFIARRYDGLFNLYIRGGAYTTWTLAGSGTDATHTTSSFVIAYAAAADELSDLEFYALGGTLTPGEVPSLRDPT